MKLKKNSIQQQTSKPVPPRPATPKAIAKAQFVDKTYVWTGR